MGLVFEVVGDWLMWKEQHSAVSDTEQPTSCIATSGNTSSSQEVFFFLLVFLHLSLIVTLF